MTFIPGSDGSNSGLFTPSRRALAGRGRSRDSGATASPERPPMTERREREDVTSSLLLAVAESDDASRDDGSSVDDDPFEVNAWAATTKRDADNKSDAMVGRWEMGDSL